MKKILIIVLFSLSTLVSANQASNNLANIFKSVRSLQGKFVQQVYDQNKHVIARTTGQFIIQRPNKFRWQVTSPLKQLTIANGKKLWLYQPDLQQVTTSGMSQKIGQTPLAILSGSTEALNKAYAITQTGKTQYQLTAKQVDSAFSQIDLLMNGRAIEKMTLKDSLGQQTVVNFSAVRVNAKVSPDMFEFSIPKGVDVIKS